MQLPKDLLEANRWTLVNDQKTPLDANLFDQTGDVNAGWSPNRNGSKLYPYKTIAAIIQKRLDIPLYPAFRNFRQSGYLCVDIDDKSKTGSPYLKLPYIYFELSKSGRGYHGIVPYRDTDPSIRDICKDQTWNVDLFLEKHFMTFYNLPLKLDLATNLKVAADPIFQNSLHNRLKEISTSALNTSDNEFFGDSDTPTDLSKYTDRKLSPLEEAIIQRTIRIRLRYKPGDDKSVVLASYLVKAGFSLHAKREFNKYSFYDFLALLMFVAEHKTPKREKFNRTFNSDEVGLVTWLQYAIYHAARYIFDELNLSVKGSVENDT